MASLDNVRISLKIDDLSNWISSNIVLKNGEVALVRNSNGNIKVKVGDGVSQVSALDYLNETEFFTKKLSAHNIDFGLKNVVKQYSVAEGYHVSALGAFSHAAGYNTEVLSDHTFAFVWNGQNHDNYDYDNRYKSNGSGTFSLNPTDGLSGIYIGEETLAQILNDKIYIDGNQADTLSINHISQSDYHDLVIREKIDTNTLYIISSDQLNAYGKRIINVETPLELSDAANKEYVDLSITNIKTEIFENINNISNDLSTEISSKIKVNNNNLSTLNIYKITPDEYQELIINDQLDTSALYFISSDSLNMYGEQIKNLAPATESLDAVNLEQLLDVDKKITDLKKYEDHRIHDFQIIRPNSQSKLFVKIYIYTEQSMTNLLLSSDSAINTEYYAAYLNSNEQHTWITPSNEGLGYEFANYPVLVKLTNMLRDKELESIYSKLFILYEWYFIEDSTEIVSDKYSIVVPSYTEVGANASDYVTKVQHEEVLTQIRANNYKFVTANTIESDYNLSCYVENKTITTINIPTDIKSVDIIFPTKSENNYVRDFILNIDILDNIQRQFNFSCNDENGSLEPLTYISDDSWQIFTRGKNMLYFTEIELSKFLVSKKHFEINEQE